MDNIFNKNDKNVLKEKSKGVREVEWIITKEHKNTNKKVVITS